MSDHHESSQLLSLILPESLSSSVKNKIVDSLLVSTENTDSIVFSIIRQFKDRADFGKKKYGTTLDREDLSSKDWIQHAQEELMDAILYLEKLKNVL